MVKEVSEKQIKQFPGGSYILARLYAKLFSSKHLTKFTMKVGEKHSLVFSNIPAFVQPTHLYGMELNRMYLMLSSLGTLTSGISLISVMDQINCNVTSDEMQIKDLDLFVSIFNRKIQEHGIGQEEKEKKE